MENKNKKFLVGVSETNKLVSENFNPKKQSGKICENYKDANNLYEELGKKHNGENFSAFIVEI